MMAEPRPLAEITQTALKVLYREIGVVNTVRFINQFTTRLWRLYQGTRAIVCSM